MSKFYIFLYMLMLYVLPAYSVTNIWVSTTGNDSNNGSEASPLLTLTAARDAVRAIMPTTDDDVVVNLRGGTYRLTAPLSLEARDSGTNGHCVIWQAAPGETPIICGSIALTNWSPLSQNTNIYYATITPGTKSRQLYVNSNRMVRAATSNYPVSFLPTETQGIRYVVVTNYNDPAWADPAAWTNAAEVDAVLITQWKMMICGVESVAVTGTQTGALIMRQPAWTNANCFYENEILNTNKAGPGLWSFWQVTRFENSLTFLDQPGEWAISASNGIVYYWPRSTENMATATVELPIAEALIQATGTPEAPVASITFNGLTFRYATWLRPGGNEGYVADQSGIYLVGTNNAPNFIGHIQPNTTNGPDRIARTPGAIRFRHAVDISITSNVFEHLGAVALDFATGSKSNRIANNRFTDISSSAIQVGGVMEIDHHPPSHAYLTSDNLIENNLIERTGRDFVDSAGIFVGCTTRTTIRQNTITNVPWSGIALGWGWGLLDPGSYLGLPNASPGMWGNYATPTATRANKIINNRIDTFLQEVWDGGAIYTTGFQGDSMANGTLIAGNVAINKRAESGGNTFYTDGGTRYVTLINNISFNNPEGYYYFGPFPNLLAPLPYSPLPALANSSHYGYDTGGCRTYGDINYIHNFWLHTNYFNICQYTDSNGVTHPTRLQYRVNQVITALDETSTFITRQAGAQEAVP
jgi:hypothetical protein